MSADKITWEYCMWEADLDDEAAIDTFSCNKDYDADFVAEEIVEDYCCTHGEYPEDTEIWLRKEGDKQWQHFLVHAEPSIVYRAKAK